MKCPSCGYNSFDSMDKCKRCGSSFKPVDPNSPAGMFNDSEYFHEDVDKVDLFENDDPLLLDYELIEDYSFHGTPSKPVQNLSDYNNESLESYLILAGFGRRFIAFLFDITAILAISFFTIIIGLITAGINFSDGIMKLSYILIPVYLILCLLASTCLLFLQAYSGKSFGKILLGLRVVKEDGGKISISESFIRWVGYYLSALPLFYGYISAFFDYNLQTWHDKLSKTYVIKDSKNQQ